MLKRILLGLYDTPASAQAKAVALALAKSRGAHITALSVVDAERISPPEAVPLGADAYKEHKDAVVIARTRDHLAAIARQYVEQCKNEKVSCDILIRESDAIDATVAESDVHDVIVIGRDAAYEPSGGGASSEIAESLLKHNPRPLLVTPETAASGENVLIAYDGSLPAMRALQMYCLLNLGDAGQTVVVTVHSDISIARGLSGRAVEYLAVHGVAATSHVEAWDGDITSKLVETAGRIGARLIVMGAYGQRSWREFILGSTTSGLLAASKAPLFISH